MGGNGCRGALDAYVLLLKPVGTDGFLSWKLWPQFVLATRYLTNPCLLDAASAVSHCYTHSPSYTITSSPSIFFSSAAVTLIAMRTPKDRQPLNPPDRSRLGAPHKHAPPCTTRAAIGTSTTDLWGWPSRGGLIVLPELSALDLTFLDIDVTDISSYSHRNPDQDYEDAFCKRLLLGSKWFDSRARYIFVCGVAEGEDVETQALEDGEQPAPTTAERRRVSVAWLPDGKGFWVAEFETMMWGWEGRGICSRRWRL